MSGDRPPGPATADRLAERVATRFDRSITVPTAFFEAEADTLARACLAMARRFGAGGRLLVFGEGAQATDAQHVAVEFVHPVIVGKRALPAIALTSDIATFTAARQTPTPADGFDWQLAVLGRPQDIAMGLSPDGHGRSVLAGLSAARQRGLLTIGIAGGDGGRLAEQALDFHFVVPSTDAFVVQEVQETLYHVLWELVHVFFENKVA